MTFHAFMNVFYLLHLNETGHQFAENFITLFFPFDTSIDFCVVSPVGIATVSWKLAKSFDLFWIVFDWFGISIVSIVIINFIVFSGSFEEVFISEVFDTVICFHFSQIRIQMRRDPIDIVCNLNKSFKNTVKLAQYNFVVSLKCFKSQNLCGISCMPGDVFYDEYES